MVILKSSITKTNYSFGISQLKSEYHASDSLCLHFTRLATIGKKVARRARALERSEGARASRLVALAARQILPTRILVGAVLANQIQQLPSMAFPCLFMHICHIVSLYARTARKKLRHS